MARLTTALTYINRLLASKDPDGVLVGKELLKQYRKWRQTLALSDFYTFFTSINERYKSVILRVLRGFPQLIGQFRAFALEEYIRELLVRRVGIPENRMFWNHDIVIWRSPTYGVKTAKFDLVIGDHYRQRTVPRILVEAKIDVDAQRLRAAILAFLLARRQYPRASTFLIYIFWNADPIWFEMASTAFDHIFCFHPDRNQVSAFLREVKRVVRGAHAPPHRSS